jgi:hypothetical protein
MFDKFLAYNPDKEPPFGPQDTLKAWQKKNHCPSTHSCLCNRSMQPVQPGKQTDNNSSSTTTPNDADREFVKKETVKNV